MLELLGVLGLLGVLSILGVLELVKSEHPQPQGPARPLEVAQPGGLGVLWGGCGPCPAAAVEGCRRGGVVYRKPFGSGRVSGTGLPGPPGSARLGETTGRSRLISPSLPGQAQEAPGALAQPCRVPPGPPRPAPTSPHPIPCHPNPSFPDASLGSHVPKSGAQSQAADFGNGSRIQSQTRCGLCPRWAQALAGDPGPPSVPVRCRVGQGHARPRGHSHAKACQLLPRSWEGIPLGK